MNDRVRQIETEPHRILRYRCEGCTVCIGPGFQADAIWYDHQTRRILCRTCADRRKDDPGYRLMDRHELAASPGGLPLLRTLRERIQALHAKLEIS